MNKDQPWIDSGPGISLCREGGSNGYRLYPTRSTVLGSECEIEFSYSDGAVINPESWTVIDIRSFNRPLKVRV